MTNAELIKRAEERYGEAQIEYARLMAKRASLEAEDVRFNALIELRESFLPAVNHWDELPRENRRVVAQALIDRIEALPYDKFGLRLKIYWRDTTNNEVILARQWKRADSKQSRDWLGPEVETLVEMADSGATQIELAAAFPDRTWAVIRHRLWQTKGKGYAKGITKKFVHDDETYLMYLERIATPNLSPARSGERWNKEDQNRLLELVDLDADQLELAKAFPNRRWWLIRLKITKLRGYGIKIRNVGEIKRNETYFDYLTRIGESIEDQYGVTVSSMGLKADCRVEIRARERLL